MSDTRFSYIAYYRQKPTSSLREQREAVVKIGNPVAEYIEKESPRGGPRPKLDEAIAHAKQIGGTLVIAKLDRLVRNARVMNALMQSGVDFIACDNPNATKRTVHILVAVADDESRLRSQRMRDVAAEKKARGELLGSARPEHWAGREHRRGWKKAVKAASEKRSTEAAGRYQYLMPEIRRQREEGRSLAEIVEWLNNNGHLTTAMKPFTQTAVWRIIKRYLGEEYLGPIKSKDHPLAHVVAGNSEGALRV